MRDDADQLARGIARQTRVAVERDAVAHRRAGSTRSPTWTAKLVSVAPRSSRLNSSILPRLRSHPIQRPSRSFHCRRRWNRKKRSDASVAVLAVERLDAGARGVENLARRAAASRSARHGSRSGPRSGCADRRCRAPGPRGGRGARATRSTPSRIVGTITIVRADAGTDRARAAAAGAAGSR